jgi:ubiquinone/menaquinone biosynthesis C-methylase UbiE
MFSCFQNSTTIISNIFCALPRLLSSSGTTWDVVMAHLASPFSSPELTCVKSQQQFWSLFLHNSTLFSNLSNFLVGCAESLAGPRRNVGAIADSLRALASHGVRDSTIYWVLRGLIHGDSSAMVQTAQSSSPRVVNGVFDAETASKRAKSRVNTIIKSLPASFRPGKVLDFGCGDGKILSALRLELGLDRDSAIGCDATMIPNSDQADFTFHQTNSDLSALPVPSSSVDLVVALMSLHHVQNVPFYLQELSRVIAPGGYFILREHDCDPIANPGLSVFLDLIHGLYALVLSDPMEDPSFVENFFAAYRSQRDWRVLLESEYGFICCSNSRQSSPCGPQRFHTDVFRKIDLASVPELPASARRADSKRSRQDSEDVSSAEGPAPAKRIRMFS